MDEYEIRKIEYDYDEYGRLNYKQYIYGSEYFDYNWSNFKYDNNGNVKSCTESEEDDGENWDCNFTYDENNNCLSSTKTIKYSNGTEATIQQTFSYDTNGNIITENYNDLYEYKDGGFSQETFTRQYDLTYENGLCTLAKVSVQGMESDEEGSRPFDTEEYIELYKYDENGNRTEKHIYYESTGDYHIQFEGKNYYLSRSTKYIWKKLGELNNSSDVNNDADFRNGFSDPVQLKQVSTNGKTSLKERPYHLTVDGLYMISDTDGYKYLVLTYTVRNQLINAKVETGIGSIKLIQNGENLEAYFKLSEECKVAYSDIMSNDWVPNELRPNETRTETEIFEVYDTTSDIQLKISPDYYYGDDPDKLILMEYSFD